MKNILVLFSVILLCCAFIYKPVNAGKPWQNKMQQIPGKIECEYYDEGGEGIAYHDSDSVLSMAMAVSHSMWMVRMQPGR